MPASRIADEEELDLLLSEPTDEVVKTMAEVNGDLLILGVAGKMGPSLARMARRAMDMAGVRGKVIGVARFSAGNEGQLRQHGIQTICCNLLDAAAVQELPDAPCIIYMAGRKFGSTEDSPATWAINSFLPGLICQRYARSKIVAFSTGNVYGLVPVDSGGSRETDHLNPLGEYAASCLGRERVLEYFSRSTGIPMAIIRLNYACELRYGLLVDLAQKVWEGQSIDLAMGYFNVLWQGDANAMTLRALAHTATPPRIVNMTGPETLSVRKVGLNLGTLMGKPVRFTANEASSALLSNAQSALSLLGPPRVSTTQLLEWVADWVMRGGRSLGKPTHFESRDGKF